MGSLDDVEIVEISTLPGSAERACRDIKCSEKHGANPDRQRSNEGDDIIRTSGSGHMVSDLVWIRAALS